MGDRLLKESDVMRIAFQLPYVVNSAFFDAVKALPSADSPEDKWIPIKWHYITDEEREESGYPKDWVYYLDCEMPEDGQEILVTTKHGYVEKDVCYLDDGYSLDSGWDWIEDIVAWMEMPPVYQEEDNK